MKKTHFIFVTGGVLSSLGKGIASASLGALLQTIGYKIRLRKLDPYLNVDAGTMSPLQHGEVFVTQDGSETDLDLGHYERFTGVLPKATDHTTSGKIFSNVIARERKGDYLGTTVQVIPHVTDAIKEFLVQDLEDEDFVICEIGGTVGDIEGLPFLEAIRQFAQERPSSVMFIHLTLVPYLTAAKEIKTKPTQHSVKELSSLGIQPHIILCRCDHPIPEESKKKLALFCNIRPESVIEAPDVDTIYEVPLRYHAQGLTQQICQHFNLTPKQSKEHSIDQWHTVVHKIKNPESTVRIAIVGKYISYHDAYKSLIQALLHGAIPHKLHPEIIWIDAETLTSDQLKNIDAILVPGGFGERGIEGKMAAIRWAREQKIPFLGICLGMQLAVIEFARTVLNLPQAHSTEFDPQTPVPIVGLMTEWSNQGQREQRHSTSDKGGTMRLGAFPCKLEQGSLAEKIYNTTLIFERHRHRYEVNAHYRQALSSKGLIFSGISPDDILPEIIELKNHPWFVAVQFHPEYQSQLFRPHPLFSAFLKAAMDQSRLI